MLELKPSRLFVIHSMFFRLNRTMLELKLKLNPRFSSNVLCLNRTMLELKLHVLLFVKQRYFRPQSYHAGIETKMKLYNDGSMKSPQSYHAGIETRLILQLHFVLYCLNRTMLELKRTKGQTSPHPRASLNRTMLELKQQL